ncbi:MULTISPECIES: C40 family peptidase [Pseudoxanthomonas]|uniref:Cell wall-associated NlpC family hydrolase n=1 Tax=Pseudoxanthomonas taiwanensis J19 TaxID=935569 RepID=A0A562D8U9_9GAMM|nr:MULTISPECIES: C40 family peptidase [Pseudoxanthomonas]TWH06044.1 cell wall-associated NlpC family hydrolase [Pseudoxanthomonas taiwanensis J19]
MTTEARALRTPAATQARSRARLLFLLCTVLPVAPAMAAPEPAPVEPEPLAPATILEVPAPVPQAVPATAAVPAVAAAPQAGGLRGKADAAASATLAVLLPHLSRNDGMLLDRSANFAGDVNRLLNQEGEQAGGKLEQVVKAAMGLLGTPYRWGGSGPDGFDCSGLVSYVFRNALGIELPRASRDMATRSDGKLIRSRDELNPGDLVFFGARGRINHVGIYVGSGQFLHAPSRGKDVRVDSLASGYWGSRFVQARRVEI